jgi:pimeloyl-ACP methyl ester carboxylesterase
MKSLNLIFISLLGFGCGGKTGNNSPDMTTPPTTLGTAPMLAMSCGDEVTDVYTLPTGLPAMDMSHRGDVFHCAISESLTASKVNSQIDGYNSNMFNDTYADAIPGNVTSGFWTYRIAYRTLRNTPTGGGTPVEGDTAAVLVIPEKPLANAPLVVWSHGSVGVAPSCAPSMLDLSGAIQDEDFPINIYRLAGYGYTVIAPDYSGFSYGQAPGYFNAEDEAHAVLDATRAAANILPSPPDKVVLVGHSQGGHAALSAQSYSGSYGMQGTLVGVATFAPLWASMSIWAAGTTSAAALTTADNSTSILYTMEYAYSASALRGDPAMGLDVFLAAKRDAVKDTLLGGACYDTTKLQALGTTPADFYDPDYINNVGFNCAANPISPDCTMAPSTPAGDAPLWVSRWQQDRPPLNAQSAPILVWYGGKDTTVKPGWAQCARERFAKDLSSPSATTTIKYCYDANAIHRDIIRGAASDFVNQWIAARAGIGTDPTPDCTPFPTSWTDPDGTTGTACETPPNDL